ncbi:MAG: chorismate mutase [Acidimicrobiales bacterium]
MPAAVRALRGATTIEADTREAIADRVVELLEAMLDRNGADHDDLISVWFTATDDIHSMFPAEAARKIGFGDIPLLCARELDIDGAAPMCIRVLMHLATEKGLGELHHVYLHGAVGLRDDLPE